VELELVAVRLGWNRTTYHVVSLISAGYTFKAGNSSTAGALKRVAIEEVDSASVVPAGVVILLGVAVLVPVVDAVESELQIAAIFVEFKAIQITVAWAKGTLTIKVLNAT